MDRRTSGTNHKTGHWLVIARCLGLLGLPGAVACGSADEAGGTVATQTNDFADRNGIPAAGDLGDAPIGVPAGGTPISPSPDPADQSPTNTPPPSQDPGASLATDLGGYIQLPAPNDGFNLEQVSYPASMDFDKQTSLAAFEQTLYPLLRENCSGCHSTETRAQAPIHSDSDVALAHEYALTRVNFRHPEDSKFVVRMVIDRHNCFKEPCSAAGEEMLAAVEAWSEAVLPALPAVPRSIPEDVLVSEQEVRDWIAADRASLAPGDADYMVYASAHELHNAGVSAYRLNIARAGLSKALNSTARWAPVVVNPVDINDKGMVYRFDTRDYWGYNKGVRELIFGGSDDTIFAGNETALLRHSFNFTDEVSEDPAFAKMVWERVLEGSKDAYRQNGAETNVEGFKSDYVELSQLVYTLTRPDVYNSIMALPVYATELEDELGVIKGDDSQPYQWMAVEKAITIDARLIFRAQTTTGGFYWKTFDIFTGDGQPFVFWEHPVPKYVASAGATARDLSLVGSLVQPVGSAPAGCEPADNSIFILCTNYTGGDGVQQQASEIIWDLPNGLQGYAIYGGLNQRRVDAFSFIVRDPRRVTDWSDEQYFAPGPSRPDTRLFTGGSCIGCHVDGMNRASNDMRDWLDEGVMEESWTSDPDTVEQVEQLYPPTDVMRPIIEEDRQPFLEAMAEIRHGMVLGDDKNLHVEPVVWTFEWAQAHYSYADTTSN